MVLCCCSVAGVAATVWCCVAELFRNAHSRSEGWLRSLTELLEEHPKALVGEIGEKPRQEKATSHVCACALAGELIRVAVFDDMLYLADKLTSGKRARLLFVVPICLQGSTRWLAPLTHGGWNGTTRYEPCRAQREG